MQSFLYFIVFVEGYAVLSAELLAMRQVLPYVGNDSAILSILIAGVLMPLAVGSYVGGRLETPFIRQKLRFNFLVTALFLTAGLSFFIVETFFYLWEFVTQNRLVLSTVYTGVFLVYPMFLMGQVIPLALRLFRRGTLSDMTGKMLCLSTLGSFLGSVAMVLVLLPLIGVFYAVCVIIGLLVLVAFMLSRHSTNRFEAVSIGLVALLLNNHFALSGFGIVYANQYNTTRLIASQDGAGRILSLNGNYSSGYHDKLGVTAPYVAWINEYVINPMTKGDEIDQPRHDILVIGAGGFTMGIDDTYNRYVYVDIDGGLKPVAEDLFLKKKITPNKDFVVTPVRRYLRTTDRRFDLVLFDAYSGGETLPEHLMTYEFFQQIKSVMRPGGRLVMNTLGSFQFQDAFSRHLDNTVRAALGDVNRFLPDMGGGSVWRDELQPSRSLKRNVLYEYQKIKR